MEESDARVAPAALRFVVVYSNPLAQQSAQIYAAAQAKEAVALADHVTRVQARWFAWLPGALTQRTRRARRGRPAKTDPPSTESGYGFGVEVEALAHPDEDNGWTVLATTVSTEVCTDAEILQAYQEQHTTGESGLRWIKNPAAISPVWLEQPERMVALAMRTVLGVLVSSLIQRQVHLYLRTHDQQIPGNKGTRATPTVAVVLALFAHRALAK